MVWISMPYQQCTVKIIKEQALKQLKKYITDSNIQSLSVGTQLHGVYLIFQQGKTTAIGEI